MHLPPAMLGSYGRKPFRQPRFAGIDFLAAANQAHNDTPIIMTIEYFNQEARF